MLDHLIIKVRDHEASKAFYTAALAPLGYAVVMEFGAGIGMGVAGKPDFWFHANDPGKVDGPLHVAFRADNRELVDAFYAAAMAAGGTDNGGPGLRSGYHPNYYGAFVRDPDGNNIEAVCHDPVD